MLMIERERPDQPEVQHLFDQADARSASLYPTESRFGSPMEDLLSEAVRFFVARDAGHVIGCGGYVLAFQGLAELKRVFVVPAARGRNVGRRIILGIEQVAQAEGVNGLLLETGVKSVEAIGLYRRLGYTERGPFGAYGPDPSSVFMEKHLALP